MKREEGINQMIDYKAKRRKLNLTQEALGRNIGVSAAYISMLEHGLRTPSPAIAKKLSIQFKDPNLWQEIYNFTPTQKD